MLIRSLSGKRDIQQEVEKVGAERGSIPFFKNKSQIIFFKIYGLKAGAANILKQELLSRGGDLIIHRQCAVCKIDSTDAVMMGTYKTYKQLIDKLSYLPYWNFPQLKRELEIYFNVQKNKKNDIQLPRRGNKLKIWGKPLIMGIINVTPDSFFSNSRFNDKDLLLRKVEEMVQNGADIIDIGGESTRPGAEKISLEEELARIVPAIGIIRECFEIPISIDTYKSEVARQAIAVGADIINDISGLQFDEKMVEVVAQTGAPIVIMHIKGTPKDMQTNPIYKDVINEVCDYFAQKIEFAVNNGIRREQIILDPGIGFGKRLEDNLEILKYTDEFNIFGLPILIGASRKSLIRDVLQLPVDERLEGTLATTAIAFERGANIIRVHDVKENRRFIDMMYAIREV